MNKIIILVLMYYLNIKIFNLDYFLNYFILEKKKINVEYK